MSHCSPKHDHRKRKRLNAQIYENLSNAVYQAGFARREDMRKDAVVRVFATLDGLETRLAGNRFLLGAILSYVDLRLFSTLVRFDSTYHAFHGCVQKRLVDYPNLMAYTKDVFSLPGVRATVNFKAIEDGASFDAETNPYAAPKRMVTATDWDSPHGRETLGGVRIGWSGKETDLACDVCIDQGA